MKIEDHFLVHISFDQNITNCRNSTWVNVNSCLHSEAVAWRCSVKRVFLEFLQNSQENTCVRVSFSIMLEALGLQLY